MRTETYHEEEDSYPSIWKSAGAYAANLTVFSAMGAGFSAGAGAVGAAFLNKAGHNYSVTVATEAAATGGSVVAAGVSLVISTCELFVCRRNSNVKKLESAIPAVLGCIAALSGAIGYAILFSDSDDTSPMSIDKALAATATGTGVVTLAGSLLAACAQSGI